MKKNSNIAAILFLASFMCLMFSGCASTRSQASAEAVYRDFMKACTRQSGEANAYLLDSDKHIDPCPDEGAYPSKIKADIIARSTLIDIVKTTDGWQFYTDSFFDPSSVKFSLLKLKHAILKRDVSQAASVISDDIDENALRSWLNSSDAADIYAAIAAHPMPFFVLRGKTAECEVSGRIIRFEMNDGVWKWRMFDR